jgi:hypothetical protein
MTKAREVQIDLDVAPPARIENYLQGGDANFAVDREVADEMFASVAGGAAAFRAVAQASQAFLVRAVHHLAGDVGIRQFLVAGVQLSGGPNVHDLAQAIAPESRVVYVVLDPVTLAHAHTLRSNTAEGATAYLQAKMRDTDLILRQASATLDLSRPVAVVLPANLAFVRDLDTAHQIVANLLAGVPPGSYVVITHHASDLYVDEHAEMFRRVNRLAAEGKTWAVVPRSHAEVSKLCDGLDLVEPGVVPMTEWRMPPSPSPLSHPDHAPAAMYAALAHK